MDDVLTTPTLNEQATTTSVLSRPKSKKAKAEEEATAAHVILPEPLTYEEDDFVCFVRLNWGTPAIPPDKIDYVDKYTFVGGVCRNVLYKHAKYWLRKRQVGGYILAPEATVEDISRVTGRKPEDPNNLAGMVAALTPEKILAMLGTGSAETLARGLLSQIRQDKATDTERDEAL